MTTNLREQKRRATLAAIEEHATSLVSARGYHDVTIEDICAAANISRRTFFNYVDSKEAAVLGSYPVPLTDAESEEFISQRHEDLTRALLDVSYRMFTTQVTNSVSPGELLRRRKAILRTTPELSVNRLAAFGLIHDSLVRTAASYLERYDDARRLPHLTPVAEARTIVGIVHAALHIGTKEWMAEPSAQLVDLHRQCHAALDNFRQLARSKGAHHD
ncbi:TetR family transcriptional regulator [Corynebacterium hindlerae]|uniref:TetR family transcriptional regulator n=1 Tax=Corynebacterium hindlerae TaxID=699041 RepID=A0A7G5FGF7_9CORY|nr:TetR/AcrR family transcriptional regulator [Corynebacterium hindlerae]QMV85698.1 TetR family transcriptional regulator [Corynebacterium hindlerae]